MITWVFANNWEVTLIRGKKLILELIKKLLWLINLLLDIRGKRIDMIKTSNV